MCTHLVGILLLLPGSWAHETVGKQNKFEKKHKLEKPLQQRYIYMRRWVIVARIWYLGVEHSWMLGWIVTLILPFSTLTLSLDFFSALFYYKRFESQKHQEVGEARKRGHRQKNIIIIITHTIRLALLSGAGYTGTGPPRRVRDKSFASKPDIRSPSAPSPAHDKKRQGKKTLKQKMTMSPSGKSLLLVLPLLMRSCAHGVRSKITSTAGGRGGGQCLFFKFFTEPYYSLTHI